MLTGKHVILRAITEGDLPQLLEWRNRPEYRQYFREYRELSIEQQHQWYTKLVLNDPTVRMFSIIEKDTGRLLGACGLVYIDWVNKNADFSIYIGADDLYIDDTLAVDAGITMLKYGFDELGLHRVWSEIYSIDPAKPTLFATLGFRLEGEHKETHWTHGKWVDSHFYGLLAREFNARFSTTIQPEVTFV